MKWLVAGYGDVVVRRGIPALRELGEEVAAVCGRRLARARQVAAGCAAAATDDAEAWLPRVDAVYIATPVALHVPLVRAALRAGVHALTEKPLAGGGDAGPGLLAEVRPGVTVGVAYYRRLDPALNLLRAQVRAARPRHVEITYRTPFEPPPDHPMSWRTDRAASGGGVLADAGSHRLDLLCWLLGTPATVAATLTDRHPGGAERRGEVRMRWDDGVVADVECDWQQEAPIDRLTVSSASGLLVVDPLDGGVLRGEPATGACTVRAGPVAANRHVPLFADFLRAVTTGAEPACPLRDALLVDRLLALAERSSEDGGTPVPLR
jgi:predicted dehydrogenase